MESRAGYLRSAYFFYKLHQSQGLSLQQIASRVLENQYINLIAPSEDTIAAYFEFKRDLSVDPFGEVELPFLLAMAREFPQSEDNYFHPCFDMLFGVKESIAERVFRGKLFPQKLIAEIERREKKEFEELGISQHNAPTLAGGMRAHNQAQKRVRGRPKSVAQNNLSELNFAHNCMLRLPEEVRDLLFEECKDMGPYVWTRSYRSVEQEISDLERFPTIEGLAALLAMLREAAQIGDRTRLLALRSATLDSLPNLTDIPKMQTFTDVLWTTAERFCSTETPRLYELGAAFEDGRPASWKGPQMFKHLEQIGYAPRLGSQPEVNAFDCVLNPELLKRIRMK